MNAPAVIVAGVDWENINGVKIKMGCITVGTSGVPAPFEPCHYVRKDIADGLQCALVCLADAYASCNGEDHPAYARARAAIAKAKGEAQ